MVRSGAIHLELGPLAIQEPTEDGIDNVCISDRRDSLRAVVRIP